jgi:hypothetical protein
VTFLGPVAVGPLHLDASSSVCPTVVSSPLMSLTLHLLYLTLADWCTEKVTEHAVHNKPPSELPLLPRCVPPIAGAAPTPVPCCAPRRQLRGDGHREYSTRGLQNALRTAAME